MWNGGAATGDQCLRAFLLGGVNGARICLEQWCVCFKFVYPQIEPDWFRDGYLHLTRRKEQIKVWYMVCRCLSRREHRQGLLIEHSIGSLSNVAELLKDPWCKQFNPDWEAQSVKSTQYQVVQEEHACMHCQFLVSHMTIGPTWFYVFVPQAGAKLLEEAVKSSNSLLSTASPRMGGELLPIALSDHHHMVTWLIMVTYWWIDGTWMANCQHHGKILV